MSSEVVYRDFNICFSSSTRFDVSRGICVFVYFDYHEKMIDLIKGIPSSMWISELKCWELRKPLVSVFIYQVRRHIQELQITPHFLISEDLKETSKNFRASFDSTQCKTTPYSHQIEGVNYAIRHPRYILGDEMGCGKTKQIIDLACWLRANEGLKHCLIICGVNGNKYNWRDEIQIHSDLHSHIIGTHLSKRGKIIDGGLNEVISDLRNPPDCFFYIMNVEKLRGGARSRKKGQRHTISEFPVVELIKSLIDSEEIGLVAFDEIHKCKTPTSKQAQALLWINCPREVAMTGTPIMNSPLDLYVPFKWLGLENRDYWSFLNRYAVKDEWGSVVGYKNAQELIDILSCYQIRRLKSNVLDLPPKIFHEEYVELSDNEWKVYKCIQGVLSNILFDGEAISYGSEIRSGLFDSSRPSDPLSLSIKLRQAVADTSIVSDVIKESSKIDRLEEIVEDVVSNEGKVIVFSNWTTVTNIVRNRLKKYNCAYITGEVSQEDRDFERKRFQEDPSCKVIIGTIPAMGTGFTLTAANTVIFMDEPWTQASRQQAEDRAHRAGTKWPVDIYYLIAKDTIDEHVHEVVENKGDLADLIIDGKVNPKRSNELLKILTGR